MTLWLLRALWFSLPVTAGPAATAAFRNTSTAVHVVAAIMLWLAWAAVLFATLLPRPLGLTAARVAAADAVVLAVLAGARPSVGAGPASLALVVIVAFAIVASRPAVGAVFVNGASYGDERRFPLRIPPALWIAPVPLAAVIVGAGATIGPLLLAARAYAIGAVVTVVGSALAFGLGRSLHSLSRRWVVLVPAGLVLHDPLTLADPVLFPRDRIHAVRVVEPRRSGDDDTLDIRLAALGGSLALDLTDEAQIVRARPGSGGGEVVHVSHVLFSPSRPGDVLDLAHRRRIRVR